MSKVKPTGRPAMFTKEEDLYILDNYMTKTSGEIGEILGYGAKQIQARALRLGMRKKRVFDNRYFKDIDTKEKAYWLGLLYADGWVICDKNRSNYEISIELQRNDKYMLERLNNVFGGVFQIKDIDKEHVFIIQSYCNTHSSVLRMYSRAMAEDLVSNGVVQNKTYKNEYPVVSDDLFIDFYRGYFDGNGCIYSYTARGKNRVQINITTPNHEFALFCQKKLLELYGISSNVYKENDMKTRVVVTKTNDMRKLCGLMYADDNAPKLLRKYNIYISNLGPQAEKSA